MKLGTRLWTAGALVPGVVMAVGLLIAGQVFRAALSSSLDQGLLAQAAAESVSLFDRADGPHLHMAESPLLEAVRPFAPTGALYDDTGALVAHFPPLPHPDEGARSPPLEGASSELSTRTLDDGQRQRELVARVKDGAGRRYVLRLSASLAQVDESVRAFYVVSLVVVLSVSLLLAAVQTWWGRRLARRLAALSSHLARVQRGELELPPADDAERDEVAELREVLATTTAQLKKARTAQDRLLADAAHELRTPLTLMRTTLDLALRKERSAEELRAALSDARAEVDRLARLANALLDVAAAARGWDLSAGDLCGVVDEAAEGVRAAAEEAGVWVEVECERPAPARFNATALRQALDNLLSNALRFAPKGTAIQLSLRRHGPGWRIAVRDHGPGIPEHLREAVFAPFHREDPRGGSGLGLAIASEVMRQHRGSASALTPGEGPGALVVLDLTS
jgi:signal transduction histidine kinase